MLERVLKAFGLSPHHCTVIPVGSGLINHTWKVDSAGKAFILQRINDHVFRNPPDIAHNISAAGHYLHQHFPGYLFAMPVLTVDQEDLFFDKENGYFRLMPFIPGSHTIDTVSTPGQAYEAADQFGQFSRLLAGFNIQQLRTTLYDFHNLALRYRQFEQALQHGDPLRIQQSARLIDEIKKNREIVDVFEKIKTNAGFRLRATHHDTKISNVLFDEAGNGLCVIDLDTLMQGYFISDVGDMIRTYLSPVSEEEKDFSKIEIRDEYFISIVKGYLGQMLDELSHEEKEQFVYAGKFMIYMQAIRFLTDHLNNDIYYGSKYEGHNLVRAGNQLVLLQRLMEKEQRLQSYIEAFAQKQLPQ